MYPVWFQLYGLQEYFHNSMITSESSIFTVLHLENLLEFVKENPWHVHVWLHVLDLVDLEYILYWTVAMQFIEMTS